MKKILKNSLTWFLCLPILTIGIASFFVPLGYDTLCKTLMEQHEIENRIASLSSEIRAILNQPQDQQDQQKLDALCSQLKQATNNLAEYKNDWGYTIGDAVKTYIEKGTGNMYQPFVWFMIMGVLFLAAAATPYRNIPFYIRAGSISTGVIIHSIVISQWLFVTLYVPAWYSQLAGLIVSLACAIGIIVSCSRFQRII